MEENAIHKLKQLLNKKIFQRIDRKILVYMVFVAISAVFWLLNELSNDYTTTINYPVRFTNVPKNKILVSDLPKKLTLNVKAYGYTLVRYKLSPAAFPVVINLKEFGNNIATPSVKQFRLQTRTIRQTIGKQMPNDIEVLDIYPDTILFQFANIIEKKVPIKANVKMEFEDECMLSGNIYFKPDSIIVKGPNTLIDTLSGIYGKFQKFDGLSKPLQRNIGLKEIHKLSFEKKRVVMYLPVSKFTQANFEVTIQTKNLPDTLELKTFPRLAKVTCLVALDEYDKVDRKDFKIDVDYNDIENLLSNKLGLNLEFAPSNVTNVTYFPESVEFIIDKKP